MGVLLQNPGSNKDAPIQTVLDATLNLQDKHRHLILMDEFSIPYLYQCLKSNQCREFGCYTELDSLLKQACSGAPGQIVDPKTRMI